MDREMILKRLENGLIVSCRSMQFDDFSIDSNCKMPDIERVVKAGNVAGVRANTIRDIASVKSLTDLPVIGSIKRRYQDSNVCVTVTMQEVDELVGCGVDVIAIQGTSDLRPDYKAAADFIRDIKRKYPNQLIMADIATFNEAMNCAVAGADFVSTAMRGHTCDTRGVIMPDYAIITHLATRCGARIIAEGNIDCLEMAKATLKAGAFAVVVEGTACF